MFFIWQTTGIDKMRVGAAKLSSTLIHKVCKCFGGTGDVLSNGIGTLVSGFKHDSIKTFFNRQDLIFVTGNAAASIINGIDSIVGKGDFFIHLTVLKCQQYSHDLGDTCRVMLFINGFGIQDRSGGCFHDNGRFSIDLWTGWPILP